jgi:hypothetical protein
MKYLLGISYFGASIFLLVSIFFDWGGGFCPESFWFFSKIFVLIAAFCAFGNGVFAFRGSSKEEAESDKEMVKFMLGVFVFVLLWHFFIVLGGHPLNEVGLYSLIEKIDIIWGVLYCLLALVGLGIISWFTAK